MMDDDGCIKSLAGKANKQNSNYLTSMQALCRTKERHTFGPYM